MPFYLQIKAASTSQQPSDIYPNDSQSPSTSQQQQQQQEQLKKVCYI